MRKLLGCVLAVAALLASPAAVAAQTIELSDTAYRELWRGEAAAQAGIWLDRGELGSGDTRRDLIMGGPGWSTDRGRVYVLFGGPVVGGDNNLANVPAILVGDANGDRFGTSTAAGHVSVREGDLPAPLRDLVVGAPGASGGRGKVYLFYGGFLNGDTLSAGNAQVTITGAPGDALGTMVATGDIDGDGYREIFIGAPGNSRVYVFKGGAGINGNVDLATTSPLLVIQGAAGSGVGSVLAAGDITGDGVYDLAIGAPTANGGAVYVIRGRSGGGFASNLAVPAGADATFSSIEAGDRAGASIDIGAVDSDAIADLVIGAPNGDGAGNARAESGEVYIVWGVATLASRSLAAADVTMFGAAAGHHAGADVSVGDVDRLPPLEVAILAPDAGAAGQIHVVLGRARSSFTSTIDLASASDRLIAGDAGTGRLASVLIYDHTGEGAEDIVSGVPTADASAGRVYIAYSGVPARITSPARGSTLSSNTVTFGWDSGTRVTGYWIDVGSTRGGYEFFSNFVGTARSLTVNNIPLNGGTIWLRVRSLINGAYQIVDESYRTVTPSPAQITSPAAGTMLAGGSQTFSWSAGTGVAGYWLDVGQSQGGYEIFQGFVGTERSRTISGIPLNGGPLWVRLRSLINGAYQFRDYQFVTPTPAPARITSPSPGATLPNSTVTFQWDAGVGVQFYWVDVGSVRGAYEYYSNYVGQSRQLTVSGLPINGGGIWVRLRSFINGQYVVVDQSFTAATAAGAQIVSPAANAILDGTSQTFNWNAGVGAQFYWVNVGTTQGGYEYYSNFVGQSQQLTVTGLPIDGRPIWVRLMSYIQGAYRIVDHQFRAASPGPARITAPTVGARLGGATQAFHWNKGVGVSFYWVNVGSTQGGYEYYSNFVGQSQMLTVSGLPIDGRPIWVRLMSYINGEYQFVDHQFTAAVPTASRIISPVVGSALMSSTQTFAWDNGVGVQFYWMDVGTSQGGYNIFSNYVGTVTSYPVSGIPISGGDIWVRLYSRIGNAWVFVDHRFTTQP